MQSIILPSETDSQIKFELKGETVVVEAYDLDVMVYESNKSANERGVGWAEVFAELFEEKYKYELTTGQINILYTASQKVIRDLKKKCFEELDR